MACTVDTDLINTLIELTRYEEQAKCKYLEDFKKLSGKVLSVYSLFPTQLQPHVIQVQMN